MRRPGLFLALALGALACLPQAARAALSLPQSDSFGYSANFAPFLWTDISGTGTPVNSGDWVGGADDGSLQVDLTFNFRFYGSTFTKVFLSSNGYAAFGTASSSSSPNCLSNVNTPSNIAAAYWMDLDPSLGGTVHYEVLGLAPNRSMVMQFTNVRPHVGSGAVTFQIILNEGSNSLDFVYVSTSGHDSGASADADLRSAYDCPNHTSFGLSCQLPNLLDGSDVHISYPGVEPICGTFTITTSPTITNTFSASPTRTLSSTRTDTPTITLTSTPTPTPSITPTDSDTFTPTSTASPSPTYSITLTETPSFTETPSSTQTDSETVTDSPTATETGSSTETPSSTATASETPSATATGTATPSLTTTLTWSASPSFSSTSTLTLSSTATPSSTLTQTSTSSPTATLSSSSTQSPTLTPSFTLTATATLSSSPTATATATCSPTRSVTPTNSATSTTSPTSTITPTYTQTPTATATFTSTATLYPPATKPGCLVLGQLSFNTNSLSPASAGSLQNPGGVALDTRVTPFRVYISDTANHRVLYWNNGAGISLGAPADGVIGQTDFSSASANRGGAVAANTLSSPRGLVVDPGSGALWVADSGNHRVLRFPFPPSVTNSAADAVLGQGGSFSSAVANLGGVSAGSLNAPVGLGIDSFGTLAVADTGNHRVLRFASPSNGSSANASWGQGGGFSGSAANAGGLGPQSLNAPEAVLLLANQLWVSDSGNHRVLRYDLNLPLTQSATVVLGQANFGSNSSNRGFGNPADDRLNSPRGLGLDLAGRVLVADSGNHRVMGFEPPFGSHAAQLWGQSSFAAGSAGVGNDSLSGPSGLGAGGSTLIVADTNNQRVLLYGCGAAVPANTSTSTFTPTATVTPTFTQTPTSTITPSITATWSISPTFSPSLSSTISLTPSVSPTPSASATLSPSSTRSPSPSPTPSITLTPTATISRTVPPSLTPFPRTADAIIPYPNPAQRSAGRACFAFPVARAVEIELYDLLGQPVATLDQGKIQAAQGLACWDLKAGNGQTVAPGIYFVRILTDGQSRLSKFTVR